MNFIDSIQNFVTSIDYASWRSNIKSIFGILTFIFMALAIFSYIKAHLLVKAHREHERHKGEHPKEHGETEHGAEQGENSWETVWQEIKNFAESIRDSEWKLAVIEADKVVDDALKAKGLPGDSMGERLMMIKPNELLSLQDLWDAHKLRNLIVHDTSYNVTHEQATAAVDSFGRTLRELGFIK